MRYQAYKRDEGSFRPSPQRSILVWYQRVPLVPFTYRTSCRTLLFQSAQMRLEPPPCMNEQEWARKGALSMRSQQSLGILSAIYDMVVRSEIAGRATAASSG